MLHRTALSAITSNVSSFSRVLVLELHLEIYRTCFKLQQRFYLSQTGLHFPSTN